MASSHFAQSANRARLNREPSLLRSAEMTDRGERTDGALPVRCYHVSQAQLRLMLREIALGTDAGRALGFELNVEQLITLPWSALAKSARTSMLLEAGVCRRMGAGGLDGSRDVERPLQAGNLVALPLCRHLRSRIFFIVASLSKPAPVPSWRPL